MEERKLAEERATGRHKIILERRRSASLTGVKDVISFDENEILLETDCGLLTVKGKQLHVRRLSLEKEEAELDGFVEQIEYSAETGFRKPGESWLSRLLR